jgi:hypothetical protein
VSKTKFQKRAFQRTRFRAVWGTIGRGKYVNGHFIPYFSVSGLFLLQKLFEYGPDCFLVKNHHKFSAQPEYRVKKKKFPKKVEGSYYAPLYFFWRSQLRSWSSFFFGYFF